MSDLWRRNPRVLEWVQEIAALCSCKDIHFCDGSLLEYQSLCKELVDKGVFTPLNPNKRPRSFWCHSDPLDVARVEEATFICSRNKEDAGPTNNWKDPDEMKKTLNGLFKGAMKGRIMYVVPFCMGPPGSPFSLIGIELTDSPYVVCNMRLMTHMGLQALEHLGSDDSFIPCVHSVGKPLEEGQVDVPWPCNPQKVHVVHFPEERAVWSFGSGYGGNALLGKKSVALRIASVLGKEHGWLAEHMLIISVTNPQGEKKYMAAAFPSQCGKTNLALLASTLPGWKVECVGDDIAWIRPGKDGRLYAVNPEAGFFGVAPGTNPEVNPYAMQTIAADTIFTNVALTQEADVWWEGLTKATPEHLTDWQGNSQAQKTWAHPNSRFTVSVDHCPILDPMYNSPQGVPLSAILFGGRRATTLPLVYQARSWQHGVFIGAAVSSETTSAATGVVGKLRHDPFAMLPFCGYHMGDYFSHWLALGDKVAEKPLIFSINWFRKDQNGQFLWPGFGENIRVLKWIFERIDGSTSCRETFIGKVPTDLDCEGLRVDQEALFTISPKEWLEEIEELRSYFSRFAERLPLAFIHELQQLEQRVLGQDGKSSS